VEEVRRKYDSEFREGAVTIVRQTGRPIVEVARKLGIGPGTLGNWVHKDRLARDEELDHAKVGPAYVRRLERELAEVRMERDLLRRSVVLWVKEAERHEALVDRSGDLRTPPPARRSGPGEAEGSLIRGTPGRADSGPDNAGTWPAPSDGSGPASKTERRT
jgi:transposase